MIKNKLGISRSMIGGAIGMLIPELFGISITQSLKPEIVALFGVSIGGGIGIANKSIMQTCFVSIMGILVGFISS